MPKGHGPALDTVGVPLCVRLGLLYRKDKDMAEKEPSQRQLRVGQEIKKILAGEIERGLVPVSYTHLTLPTILLV